MATYLKTLLCFLVVVATASAPLVGQWTNRYPRVRGYGHHVYLEGYELPTLNPGPMDPAPAPDGRLAFSARGWIWILDPSTGIAERVTDGRDLDFRPAWSPDGRHLAFVRDNDHETSIVEIELASRDERVLVSTPAIDLDPVYSPDGQSLYYATAVAGDLDLWRLDRASMETVPVTSDRGIELRPQVAPDGRSLVYLAKGGGRDQIRIRDLDSGGEQVLREGSIASMARPALSPDGGTVAVNWPTQDGWELRLVDVSAPGPWVRLVAHGLPLTPAWSHDGRWIYFSESAADERMMLKRVAAVGGPVETLPVRAWRWGVRTGTLRVLTRVRGQSEPVAARLNVLDAAGHPAVPDTSAPRFDGELGRVYFYSPGIIDLTVPEGEVTVSAVSGLTTPEQTLRARVAAGETTELRLELEPVWNARAAGWTSGEHHFHLNYGGPYDLDPTDLVPMMQAENLDVATPLLANLHNRFEDQDLWTWHKLDEPPLVLFGQEVRSHFLGHIGLAGTSDLFWPWVWGPGYQVYGTDDRPNTAPLLHARAQAGIAYYVHPVSGTDPFQPGGGRPPVELVADAVLGDLDALEIACLWSDDLATAAVWHRFLNLGIPVAPSAGTDVMNNFYRTMAVGTARVYAYTGDQVNWPTYLDALRAGRSFVTNGPMVEFTVDGSRPGEVVTGGRTVRWRLDLHSAMPVEQIEILVNGTVAATLDGLEHPGSRTFEGTLRLSAGGWIAARAHGGDPVWPSMAIYPFAHTAPVWIERVGSVDPEAERIAAQELLRLLEDSEARLRDGYGETPIPRLLERFAAARVELESRLGR